MTSAEHNPYGATPPQSLRIRPQAFQSGLNDLNDPAIGRLAEWSVLVYVAANCNLAHQLFDNVLALKAIGSSERVNVCVMFAGPYLGDSFFARLNRDTTLDDDVLFRFWTFPTDNVATFAQAQLWARIFPAQRQLMILSGHGAGWRGVLLNERLAEPYLRDPSRVVLPAPFETCDGARRAAMKKVQDRINERLPDGLPDCSRPYDVLAFDACYMANLETIPAFSEYARTAIVSEDVLPGEGYPYAAILERLHEEPAQTGLELAAFVIEESKRFYALREPARRISQVALNCAEFEAFVSSFASFVRDLNVYEDTATFSAVQRAFGHVARFSDTGNIDVIGFVRLLVKAGLPDGPARLGRAVLERWAAVATVSSCDAAANGRNGLSMYAPEPSAFDPAYLETASRLPFGLHLWSGFLGLYYLRLLGESAPGHPLIEAIRRAMDAATAAGIYQPNATSPDRHAVPLGDAATS